jgi:hypothetical protein
MSDALKFVQVLSRPVIWLGLFITLLIAAQLANAGRFGTECQRDYQNGWRTMLDHSWERCDWFNAELNDTDTQVYYYDLHGAKPWWENTNELDQVNLVYANTHGGGWSDKSVWSMWDSFTRAESTSMRLGDQSYGASIFSTYACETLKFNDGKQWDRMGSIFRGGLRIATGSHDKVYDSVTTNEVGEDYADNLQKQRTIKYAWKDANSDWYADQDLTVMATGTNQSSCQSRRDNMKWQNFTSYSRLRDGQIGWYCYWYWDNL